MLRWLPEKTLTDTYTPASQRWQIFLLAASFLFFVSGIDLALGVVVFGRKYFFIHPLSL